MRRVLRGTLIGAGLGVAAVVVLASVAWISHSGTDPGDRAEWFLTYLYVAGFPISYGFESVSISIGEPTISILSIIAPFVSVVLNWSLIGAAISLVSRKDG
jgi:hypothetical protein